MPRDVWKPRVLVIVLTTGVRCWVEVASVRGDPLQQVAIHGRRWGPTNS